MGLTKAQQTLLTRARTAGSGEVGIALDDSACFYLLAVIAKDLNLLNHFSELPTEIPAFFGSHSLDDLRLDGVAFLPHFERLIEIQPDADTYFLCLATLHKARLKYERILQTQPIPTIEQIGPRGLLQYGTLNPDALVGFLFWRKWLFDIDNRAGQETGYLFEPIIAYAIGGVPYSAKKSPIKRGGTGSQGRQVDCIRDQQAYEIKLRVTIAVSGQGRWAEELAFPNDCRASNYVPILLVLDPTPNAKLNELSQAFRNASGEAFTGQAAWDHLASLAGATMARFLDLYVHKPLQALLQAVPTSLPSLSLKLDTGHLIITVGSETLTLQRSSR